MSLVFLLFLVCSGCSLTPGQIISQTEIKDNSLRIKLDGYTTTCIRNTEVYVEENNSWRKTVSGFDLQGEHYLDDSASSNIGMMCDLINCEKIQDSVEVPLVEYVKIGEKEGEYDNKVLVPVYKTTKLSGKAKVDFTYFADKDCTQAKKFEKVLEIK